MTGEESLRLARQRIEYLERMLAEADERYDRMAKQSWEYRNDARRLEFAIKNHRERVLSKPSCQTAENERLWGETVSF
jgi:hypothetical protein